MSVPKCPLCGRSLTKYGKTKAGKQRWECRSCRLTSTSSHDTSAKRLESFLTWLMSKDRQLDMPGQGRTFRRKTSEFWTYWALPPVVDEVHRVIYVDGLYIAKNVVVLVACTDEYVLGWYLARSENSKSWTALISRIAAPDVVVSDGGSGFEKARRKVWPTTEVQRCTFHAFCQVKRYTTTRPNLDAGAELYGIAKALLQVKTKDEASKWVQDYLAWCYRWDAFLAERTITERGSELTHWRLVKARNSLNALINKGTLFTYLDDLLTMAGPLPATTNRIEGGVNAPLRQVLREHRGLTTLRRVKAVFWWCYLHTEHPLGASDILKTMPTDDDIDEIYRKMTYQEQRFDSIPQWGDAIVWGEFHQDSPWRHDWD